MREIKFRTFLDSDIWESGMYEITDLYLKSKIATINVSNPDNNEICEINLFEDEYILMQYTGLKDRNGKEIYEGDILFKDGYWSIRIEYDKGGFMVRDLDKIRYVNKCLNTHISDFNLSGWEVVGNVYENHDLLEN